ncbi:MAG: sel1 repeat family protein [Motiliproteus sp.]
MMRLIVWLLQAIAPLFFVIATAAFKTKRFRTAKWVMRCYRLAADSGHCGALSVYGHLLHLHGNSIASKTQGAIYLQRAAEQGDMKAQFQMGRIYERGFESYFQCSTVKAVDNYLLAANQGHILAIKRLQDAYQKGELGLSQDEQLAHQWQDKLPY